MKEDASLNPQRAPWHLWLVGILGLLWNSVGAFDHLMTQTRNESYMGQFTPEQLEFFYGFPTWLVAFWALAVWGGVLGVVVWGIRRFTGDRTPDRSALDIAKVRLARGEITKEEFDRIKVDLV